MSLILFRQPKECSLNWNIRRSPYKKIVSHKIISINPIISDSDIVNGERKIVGLEFNVYSMNKTYGTFYFHSPSMILFEDIKRILNRKETLSNGSYFLCFNNKVRLSSVEIKK